MKKKTLLITTAVSSIAIGIGAIYIERNSKSPQERYMETAISSERVTPSTSNENPSFNSTAKPDHSMSSETEVVVTPLPVVLNQTHTIQFEFLSYEIIEDTEMATQTKYSAENFYEGVLPDPNYLKEYTDFPAMRRDYPEFDEYLNTNGNSGMTEAEYQEFMRQHIAEYTTTRHPKTIYFFVRCRLTNINSGPEEYKFDDLRLYAMQDGAQYGVPVECGTYFDHSQHTEGEDRIHDFSNYTFENGESFESIIGFEITEDQIDFSKEIKYYIGVFPIGADVVFFNPSIDDGFIQLDALQKEK